MRGRVVGRAGALGKRRFAPWGASGHRVALGALEAPGREAGLDGTRAQDSGESAPPPVSLLDERLLPR